ncbi:hypothetical protein KHC28_08940 [Ancylobacter sonchi]|uniref:hypothetical protein n=1 Tax=Ancylobacter sonchi TaxID=1937790 RepID=UPI001BD40FB1|nr:hypothetical protein [Ancylobacter sonchi]MBS7533781.1 hypothetical protein [Ancylobacter sonchi]
MQLIADAFMWGTAIVAFLLPVAIGLPLLLIASGIIVAHLEGDDEDEGMIDPVPLSGSNMADRNGSVAYQQP